MIKQQSIKKCRKGTGKAIGFKGCGKELPIAMYNKPNFKYGLGISCGCYSKWLLNTPEGKELIEKSRLTGKKKADKEKKSENRRKKRELDEKGAMGLADMYFSRYIRLRRSENGFCTCYTCGAILPIKEIQNGHYEKRQYKGTRFHENNCRSQCKTCNGDIKHNGKQVEFRINLINEIGLQEVEEIERLARSFVKMSAKDYRDIADHYREKVNQLQKELGVKYW